MLNVQRMLKNMEKAVGCNQALIHYYFRTKEKLFWDIFSPKMEQAVEYLDAPLDEGVDFFERISNVIDLYFGMMSLDERLAPFIVNELLMSPARWTMFRERFLRNESSSQAFVKFEKMVEEEIRKGTIREIRANDLILDVMSLCMTTFIVAPKGYASGECDSSVRREYLEQRKKEIKVLVMNGLRP